MLIKMYYHFMVCDHFMVCPCICIIVFTVSQFYADVYLVYLVVQTLYIVNGRETKLSNLLYRFLLGEYDGGIYHHKWIHCIKYILISEGRIDLLHKEVIENPKLIKTQISKTLSDLYI